MWKDAVEDRISTQQDLDRLWPWLSDTQVIVAHMTMAGYSQREIGRHLEVSVQATHMTLRRIGDKMKEYVR